MNTPANTTMLLILQYSGTAVIPLTALVKDYFGHLSVEQFLRKIGTKEIDLPVTFIEGSKKSQRGVPLIDFAKYLDERIAEARRVSATLNPTPLRSNGKSADISAS